MVSSSWYLWLWWGRGIGGGYGRWIVAAVGVVVLSGSGGLGYERSES